MGMSSVTCSDAMPLDCHAADLTGAAIIAPSKRMQTTQRSMVLGMVINEQNKAIGKIHCEKLAIAEDSLS